MIVMAWWQPPCAVMSLKPAGVLFVPVARPLFGRQVLLYGLSHVSFDIDPYFASSLSIMLFSFRCLALAARLRAYDVWLGFRCLRVFYARKFDCSTVEGPPGHCCNLLAVMVSGKARVGVFLLSNGTCSAGVSSCKSVHGAPLPWALGRLEGLQPRIVRHAGSKT